MRPSERGEEGPRSINLEQAGVGDLFVDNRFG